MEIRQFVKTGEVAPLLYDRPWFVVPKDGAQAKAVAIMRKALDDTGTFGIGEIAFSGREHLVALGAPSDARQKGLMLYQLRYEEELRDPKSVLSDVKEPAVSSQELSLAKQLIEGSTAKFDLSGYRNDYEAAVVKLVNAKRKGKPLPQPERATPKGKVVNIMDALRRSLAEHPAKKGKTTRRKKAA